MSENEARREREREYARRDDHARVAELEDELRVARMAIAALEDGHEEDVAYLPESGKGRRALRRAAHDPSSARRWLGAPALLRLSRRFEGALPRDRFEALIERAREVTHDPGIVELKPHSFAWGSSMERHPSQPHFLVRVTVARGDDGDCCTELIVTDRLGALVGRLFGAFGSVVAAGGIAAPVAASLAFPMLTPVFLFGWVGGVFGTTRVLFQRLAAARARRLHEVFGALVVEIEAYMP